MYELLLLIGGLGFLAMALLGMVHGGGGARGHGGGHSVGHGHTPALGHGHGQVSHASKGFHLPRAFKGGKMVKGRGSSLLMLISPMDLFAMALGAGAAGVLLKGLVAPSLLIYFAIAGALFFNFLIIKPIFMFAMKFVSTPSEGLEGTVQLTAIATTKFDAEGKGLVQLTLDGQIVQVLANLDSAESELGERVNKGDEVTVVHYDAKHNSCVVTKLSLLRNP
ncbi:MAG: hypothetical protein ACHQ50_09815 [Fimbriimonadales bacterium]